MAREMSTALNTVMAILDNVSLKDNTPANWVMSSRTLMTLAADLGAKQYMEWRWETEEATSEPVLKCNPAHLYGMPVELNEDVTEPRLEIHG